MKIELMDDRKKGLIDCFLCPRKIKTYFLRWTHKERDHFICLSCIEKLHFIYKDWEWE